MARGGSECEIDYATLSLLYRLSRNTCGANMPFFRLDLLKKIPILRRSFWVFLFVCVLVGCSSLTMTNAHYNPTKKHHTPEGFKNNYPHPPIDGFFKWQWERLRDGVAQPPAAGWGSVIASVKPDVAFLQSNRSVRSITWLGHAAVLVQTNGLNIVTDPMFGERASPVSFAGPKRLVPLAIPAAQLPRIDVMLLSHNHYDHLDKQSVKDLNAQAGGPPLFIVPLGMKVWFESEGITNVRELDWWDTLEHKGVAIHFVPVQHWSKRNLTDRNATLWGGYVVDDRGWKFFFPGDTGYSQDFKDISAKFGPMDFAAIPIGAYAPRWFMKIQHVNPEEAVQIMQDVRAKEAMGVHWGTFMLTDEALDEPPKLLADALKVKLIPAAQFRAWAHGETVKF
jgi:N-acyl-phosphatidylethanolamine-hydrolysing phospholipase D